MSFSKYGPLMAVVAIVGVALVATISQQNQRVEKGQASGAEIDFSVAAMQPDSVPSTLQATSDAPLGRSNPLPAAVLEIDPEEQKRRVAMRIAELDQKLRAEPFDAAWAREHEEIISQVMIGRANDGFDVPMPESLDASCRSTLCRIRMTYADEEDAMQMQTKLTLGLGGAIATAMTFYQPNENGGMDLVIFAGALD